jgi:hypothetical protein
MAAQRPIPEQPVGDDPYAFDESDSLGSEGMSTTKKKNKAAEREQDRERLRLDRSDLPLPSFWKVIGDTRCYEHDNSMHNMLSRDTTTDYTNQRRSCWMNAMPP